MDATLPPPPKSPAGFAPHRVAHSVRRTSSIDADWPDGREGPVRLTARARDLQTGDSGSSTILSVGAYEARIGADRRIAAIEGGPSQPDLAALVGERGGGHLRAAIAQSLPEVRAAGGPLLLILDDLSGVSLIAPWAWSRWNPNWEKEMARLKAQPDFAAHFNRENICSGLRVGSSGLDLSADGIETGPVRDPQDPDGWHDFPEATGPGLRRARRIDVTLDQIIHIDAHFQDSGTTPEGPRSALHEYQVRATADPVSMTLLSVDAEPRVLPFAECPAAAGNVARLVGRKLADLREVVPVELRGIVGCTHLNDALRALAEVPVLARALGAGKAQ